MLNSILEGGKLMEKEPDTIPEKEKLLRKSFIILVEEQIQY